MQEFHSAASLHFYYRELADNETYHYCNLRTTFPLGSFPRQAARIWRYAMLAEMWGTIATMLCGGKVNYIENWRTGK